MPIKKKGTITILTIMEKFKNAFKSVNKFGLLALALVAFAMMSFTSNEKKSTGQKYAYDQQNHQWVLIEGLQMDNDEESPAPGTYRCDTSDEICSGNFLVAPTTGDEEPDSEIVLGDFSLN